MTVSAPGFYFLSKVEVVSFKFGCAGSCSQHNLTDGTVEAPWPQVPSLLSFCIWRGPVIKKKQAMFWTCSHPLWLNFTGCPHLSFQTQFSPSYCLEK